MLSANQNQFSLVAADILCSVFGNQDLFLQPHTDGPFRDVRFSRDQLQEIRYASLLHDFGKVGVREEVLVKAKKLYPDQLNIVQHRFDYIRKVLEADHLQRKLEATERKQPPEAFRNLEEEYQIRLAEL